MSRLRSARLQSWADAQEDAMKCETCGKWAGAHATLPGQPTEHLCKCRPSNPNACQHCGHKQNPDGGWCYMFRLEPTGPCAQHTIGVAAAMAHRLQVARRTLNSMKPNTEVVRREASERTQSYALTGAKGNQ